MAIFTADLNPKATSQLSLSEMLKMGNYLNQMDISGLEAEKARISKQELPKIQAFIQEGKYKKEDGTFDYGMINQVLPAIAPVSGPAYAKNMIELGRNDIEARSAKSKFTQEQRAIIGNVYGAYAASGTKDPSVVINGLRRIGEENAELKPYIEPAIRNLSKVPAGDAFNQQLFQASNEFLTPTQRIEAFAPKAGLTNVGGAAVQTTTKPSVRGEAPQVQIGTPSAPQGGQVPAGGTVGSSAPPTVGANAPDLIPISSELRYTGSPTVLNLNEIQRKRFDQGEKEYKDSNLASISAGESKQSIRKVREYITQATGNVPGKTVRKIGQWFAGNPELEALNKNLADLYVRQTALMGAGTDQAKADVSKITGNENITPEALKGIMDRFEATSTAVEAFHNGLKALRQRRGDINGSIQAEDFKSVWAQNYDPRIFMLRNINKSDMTSSEKQAARAKLGEGMSPEQYEEFKKKAANIERLEKGLYK